MIIVVIIIVAVYKLKRFQHFLQWNRIFNSE